MIWLIVILAAVVRMISLNQSLWLDEAINVMAAKDYDLPGMVGVYAKGDFHPPGYFALLLLWIRLFGTSEIAVRIPSVIFGSLTVAVSYLTVKKLASVKAGLVTALLLAINPLHIYYSQEARMYALAALAVTLNFYFFIRLLRGERAFWGYLASCLLVLSADYLAYLTFPAQLVIVTALRQQRVLKIWLAYILPAALVWLVWLPVFWQQLNIGQQTAANMPVWKNIVGSSGIKPVALTFVKFIIGRISHPDKLVYYLSFFPVGLLYIYLIWKFLRKSAGEARTVILGWLAVPVGLGILVSTAVPVYSYFRVLFLLVPFLAAVAIGLASLKKRAFYAFLGLAVAVSVFASAVYLANPAYQREDWRGAVRFLQGKGKSAQIIFESNGAFAPFDYYTGGELTAIGALKNFPARTEADLVGLDQRLIGMEKIYLVDYLVEISDPNRLVAQKLAGLGYRQKQVYNFAGVGFIYLYVK